MTPAQLLTEAPAPERQIEALRSLAMRKFLEARQSDDLRRDIASKLQLSDGPFFPGDKIYYWTEDKSKIKSDGSHREQGADKRPARSKRASANPRDDTDSDSSVQVTSRTIAAKARPKDYCLAPTIRQSGHG